MKSAAPIDARSVFRERYGPWAVITGASDGIGREFAAQTAARGLDVVLVARRRSVLEALAAELTARHGVHSRVLDVDLSDPAGADTIAAATADLDVGLLVAAAGFGTSGPLLDSDIRDELDMLQVNCAAVLTLTHHFGGRFARRGCGGLILLGSLVGYQGVGRAAHYAATKAWVQTLAEGLHGELRPLGVDVLAVAPGPVHSGFADRAGMVMSRAARPADVAAPALEALGRRRTIVPGALSKTLTWTLAPLPRRTRTAIMTRVMNAMTPNRTPHLVNPPDAPPTRTHPG